MQNFVSKHEVTLGNLQFANQVEHTRAHQTEQDNADKIFVRGKRMSGASVPITKQGLLRKQGGRRRNWKTRHFELAHGHLMYFVPHAKGEYDAPLGIVNMTLHRAEQLRDKVRVLRGVSADPHLRPCAACLTALRARAARAAAHRGRRRRARLPPDRGDCGRGARVDRCAQLVGGRCR